MITILSGCRRLEHAMTIDIGGSLRVEIIRIRRLGRAC
jgi:hypothetical protein